MPKDFGIYDSNKVEANLRQILDYLWELSDETLPSSDASYYENRELFDKMAEVRNFIETLKK